jgi:hypothetical protein
MISPWDYRLLGGYHLMVGLVGLGLCLHAYAPQFLSYGWRERVILLVIFAYSIALLRASYLLFHRVRSGWWMARRLQFLQVFQVALPGAAWILIVGPQTGIVFGGLEGGWLGFNTFVAKAVIYLGSHDYPLTFGINLVPVAILLALRDTRDEDPALAGEAAQPHSALSAVDPTSTGSAV